MTVYYPTRGAHLCTAAFQDDDDVIAMTPFAFAARRRHAPGLPRDIHAADIREFRTRHPARTRIFIDSDLW